MIVEGNKVRSRLLSRREATGPWVYQTATHFQRSIARRITCPAMVSPFPWFVSFQFTC